MSASAQSERGSAILEFLIVGLLVLVPLLYALLTVLRIESAAMASTQAIREAGRAFVMADSPQQASRASDSAVALAMHDQGFEIPASALTVTCEQGCLRPGSEVHLRLDWQVELPWLPAPLLGSLHGYPIVIEYVVHADAYRSGSAGL